MKFTYDSAKHGLPLSDAKLLDWDSAISWIDERKNYGEERHTALVLMNGRLYCVIYVDLITAMRIISLRKANNREMKIYEEEAN